MYPALCLRRRLIPALICRCQLLVPLAGGKLYGASNSHVDNDVLRGLFKTERCASAILWGMSALREREYAVHTQLFLFSYLLFTLPTLNIMMDVFRAAHYVEHWNSTQIAAQPTRLSFASTLINAKR
ncbi:hypothetical protein 2 [Diadegma semiclausum ichnovirus]|nr:hypothetical protein 2 [Diadegma semiclausum ichnovirus]